MKCQTLIVDLMRLILENKGSVFLKTDEPL
jgi:hypothetical protein